MATFKKALYKGIGFLFSIFTITFLVFNESSAQLQTDYPFHAISNANGDIFVTGYKYNSATGGNDILLKKISPGLGGFEVMYTNSAGNDRGYSLALDEDDNIIITGFIYNGNTESNDIIALKYSSTGGLIWDTIIASPGDDRGLSVAIFDGDIIAICGFMTDAETGRDFFTHVMDQNKHPLFTEVVSYSDFDDAATHIITDNNYAYVVGYFYNGETYEHDFKSIAFYTSNGGSNWTRDIEDIGIPLEGDQFPTSLVITSSPSLEQPVAKSKRATTFEYDDAGNNNFWTYHYDGNDPNDPLIWHSEYDNTSNDIPTAITSDDNFVYTVGYTEETTTSYDYAIIKYTKDSGHVEYHFPIRYDYQNEQEADKPSSIKLDGEMLYITGYNAAATSEYTIIGFFMLPDSPLEEIEPVWTRSFIPELKGINLNDVEKYTYCTTDKEGNVIIMAFGYNDSVSFIAGQRYDREGNVLSTIPTEIMHTGRKVNHTIGTGEQIQTNSYPNPFNPTTNISFNLPAAGFVELNIYDLSGRKIESLLNKNLISGQHIVKWDASKYSSGIYFYRLRAENQIVTKKLVLVK